MDIKTFVFLDSETTGLPPQENNKTRMTELCFVAVQSDHIKLGIFPRIQNKISFCFNPCKFINPDATHITGLSNELLEYQSTFNETVFNVIKNFLSLLRPPVCLVAHNGNRFDYPILKAEIHKTGNVLSEDILCVDSLLAFRELHRQAMEGPSGNPTKSPEIKKECKVPVDIPVEFQDGYDELLCSIADHIENKDASTSVKLNVEEIKRINETTPTKSNGNVSTRIITHVDTTIITHIRKSSNNGTNGVTKTRDNEAGPSRRLNFGSPSFRLQEIYKRLTSKEVTDAHKAEYDVYMLMECAAVLGEKFVDWSNYNARKFCDIPMMQPGKRIGT